MTMTIPPAENIDPDVTAALVIIYADLRRKTDLADYMMQTLYRLLDRRTMT